MQAFDLSAVLKPEYTAMILAGIRMTFIVFAGSWAAGHGAGDGCC